MRERERERERESCNNRLMPMKMLQVILEDILP
jgi:hypothetical protein